MGTEEWREGGMERGRNREREEWRVGRIERKVVEGRDAK